jgi:hypothetical protein
MPLTAARRRIAAWRQPRSAARIARTLWIVWAVIVWNVVFDHVIVVAGRNYIAAAGRATAASAGSFANMDDWMRPAVTRGLWIATAAGGVVLVAGLAAVRAASRRARRSADGLAPEKRIAEPPAGIRALHAKAHLAQQEQRR